MNWLMWLLGTAMGFVLFWPVSTKRSRSSSIIEAIGSSNGSLIRAALGTYDGYPQLPAAPGDWIDQAEHLTDDDRRWLRRMAEGVDA